MKSLAGAARVDLAITYFNLLVDLGNGRQAQYGPVTEFSTRKPVRSWR